MDVFISWSGPKSNAVATALHTHLKTTVQAVSAYMSSEDIRSGSRWFSEISQKLAACDFGVILGCPHFLYQGL